MGSYASKLLARYGDDITEVKAKSHCKEEDLGPSTPIDAKKTLPIDPRSATVGIPRTPIEVNCTPPNTGRRPVSAIPSYLQRKPYLETDLDNIGHLAPKKSTPLILYEADALTSPVLSNKNARNIEKLEPPTIDVTDQSSLALDEPQTGDTPISELRYKILGIDPRSPAADFDRTPILAPKSMIRLRARSQENLTRRDSLFELGLANNDQQRLSYCETTTLGNIPEVLALPEIKMKLSKAKNLNITEENSEQFDSCSSSSSSSESESGSGSGSSIETISESGEEITVIPNPNANKNKESTQLENVSGSDMETNSYGSSIDKIEDIQEIYYPAIDNIGRVLSIAAKGAAGKEQITLVSDLERKITVWRDSTSPENSEITDLSVKEESGKTRKDVIPLPKEEIMIEFDDNDIINPSKIQLMKKEEGIEGTRSKKLEFTERKNKNVDMEGKVVFQDKIFTPEGKKINQMPKVRTPLGNRSNNHGKVNNMPMKSPQQLLRGKAMSTKLHQENTPPRSMKSKLNGTQWDPDSTVLI